MPANTAQVRIDLEVVLNVGFGSATAQMSGVMSIGRHG